MQSFSAPPSRPPPRLLVAELWGLGDVALAVPFLRLAARHARVTLVAKPSARVLLARLCPEVEMLPFTAPWTAHTGKYRLHAWPWAELDALVGTLRSRGFAAGVSARADPRDHLLLALSRVALRAGFARAGSRVLLTDALTAPGPHRHDAWQALARHLGLGTLPLPAATDRPARRIVIHTGAAHAGRTWPRERFTALADRLRADGREVIVLDAGSGDLPQLLDTLGSADRFIGNDSGPGHVAAVLGVPTFTIGGSYPLAQFHPIHPLAAWIEGADCVYKPCHDFCRFATPHCITGVTVEQVWPRLAAWLQ